MIDVKYPKDILPQVGWKQNINTQDLIEHNHDAMIARKLDGTRYMCLDFSLGEDMPVILHEALPVCRIPNMSCSLLGTSFCIECFHYLPDKLGKETWTEDVLVSDEILDNEDNFNYFQDITVVAWKISKVHKFQIPYIRSFNKKGEYDRLKESINRVAGERNVSIYLEEWSNLKKSSPNDKLTTVELLAEVRVNHMPTMLNYWHFTIDQYPADNNLEYVKNVSNAWKKSMAEFLCDYLRKSFILVENNNEVPPLKNTALWEK